MSEKETIKRILKGDTQAFSYFVKAYQDMAITIAYRITQNMQDAEDAVQDSFVKAYHNLHSFRLDSKFSTWLYRIVYNTTITSFNKRIIFETDTIDNKALTEEQTIDYDSLTQVEQNQRIETLEKAISLLDKDDALILTLFYLDENSTKEVAQIISLSEANVRVKLHRARKKLGETLSILLKQ